MADEADAPNDSHASATGALRRGAAISALGEVGVLVVGFAGSIVIARYLGPADRGLLAILQVAAVLGVSLFGLGLPVATQYRASRDASETPRLIGNGLVVTAMLAALSVVAATILIAVAPDLIAEPPTDAVWFLAAALVPVTVLDYLTSGLLAAHRRFARQTILMTAGRIATLVGAIIFGVVADLGLAGALLAVLSAQVVMIVGGQWVLARGGVGFSRSLLGASYRYGVRSEVASLLQVVNARLDLLVLGAVAPRSVVGTYAIAQIVAELVGLVPNAISTALMPVIASGDGDARTSAGALRLNGTGSLVGVAAVAIGGPLLILFAYGPGYGDAIVPMLILLPGIWFLSMARVGVWLLRALGRPGLGSWLAGGEIVVMIALDIALIPPFGATGAAIASALAYTGFGVATLIAVSRIEGTPLAHLILLERSERAALAAGLRSRLRRRSVD
jgi:O-antigen/teichoic acid export membrane protein